jgi:tRNA pseudouridine38-40 synthase
LGTDFHGWQRQANAPTVQQAMETAIYKASGKAVYLSGCGRTDAGVHASYYVASCMLDAAIPMLRLPAALNAYLPDSVAVRRAVAVPDDFDARFSCISKEYTYLILNQPVRDPFWRRRAGFYGRPLDIAAMSAAAKVFEGQHDFAALMSAGSPVKSTVRRIFYCTVTADGPMIRIAVRADGFLYNMVRAITGTLIYCGVGKLTPADVAEILQSGDRRRAGPTAPPEGLYLSALTYGMEELDGQGTI